MKRGSGIKGRNDKSSGIEIRIAEALAKINPADPLILAKQAARRNRNCSDSSGNSCQSVTHRRNGFCNIFFFSFFFWTVEPAMRVLIVPKEERRICVSVEG
jgi:hypothetical protein